MAQGILEKKIKERNLDIFVDSAGTSDYHIGETPDHRAISISADYGIDISSYRGRQLTSSDFEEFDYILVMDSSNYENAIALVNEPKLQQKVSMMLNFGFPGENRSVPDPYFGGEEGFEQVYQLLDHSIDKFLDQIENV